MSTELERDNIFSAIKGEGVVRSCVSCKHYRNHWFEDATCARHLKLKYHPITGKKGWLGDVYTCRGDRCMSNRIDRPDDPCGPDGKHWEEGSIPWYISWRK